MIKKRKVAINFKNYVPPPLNLLKTSSEKANAGNRRGAAKLSRSAAENLRAVASTGEFDEDGRFLGIRVGDLLADMERHYADLWAAPTEAASTGRGRPPRLNLA